MIIVFRPHTGTSHAAYFKNKEDVVRQWIDGRFKWLCGDNSRDYMQQFGEVTFEHAIEDIRHDLYSADVLESKEEFEEYIVRHVELRSLNVPIADIYGCALRLGWDC
jgi:hypothetical protein